jgi:hypothetical protein
MFTKFISGVRANFLKGAIFLGYSHPGGDIPRNIASLLRGGRISWEGMGAKFL